MAVFVAGATGNLGGRVVRALLALGAPVKALVRPGSAGREALRKPGVELVEAELADEVKLAFAMADATIVVSTLQGLEPVIVDGQSHLLRAAERAGVARFIPSDFAADLFKIKPSANRNFDLRRRFDEILDQSPIRATSILNGAFMDLLAPGAGDRMLDHQKGRVTYFGNPAQPLDFTTMDDTAAFTARAALDDGTPRILRIAGDRVTPQSLAAIATTALGRPIAAKRMGGLGFLRTLIPIVRFFKPGRGQDMPAWQGMQYAENMFSGDGLLEPLDNGRYPDMRWTTVADFLADGRAQKPLAMPSDSR